MTAARIALERPVKLRDAGDKTLRTVKSVEGACEVPIDWPYARADRCIRRLAKKVEAAAAVARRTKRVRHLPLWPRMQGSWWMAESHSIFSRNTT
jgi:hypothetical protein